MDESPFLREIMNEGRIEAMRTAILRILARRFGEEAARPLTPLLAECTDLDRLDELFDLALDGHSIAEFRSALA